MNKTSITGIVVTFNRKESLIRCLRALVAQKEKLTNIIIVDNASTDGTINELKKLLHNSSKNIPFNCLISIGVLKDINIYVYRCKENGGGSYGFYIGMKMAYEKLHTDLYWMMDDDGYPDNFCLDKLKKFTGDYDYVMPVSIDIKNHSQLSWAVRMKNGVKTYDYNKLKESWGNVMDFVTPFNGVLLTNKCIQKVGYVNKDFFIWGDEYDHYWRCKKNGIEPKTIMNAVFYHPSQKLPLVKICFGLFRAPYVDSKLRMICLARNYTYIYKKYGQWYKIPLKFLQYSWLYLISRHFDFKGWILYIESVHDGMINDFSRHKKYLRK